MGDLLKAKDNFAEMSACIPMQPPIRPNYSEMEAGGVSGMALTDPPDMAHNVLFFYSGYTTYVKLCCVLLMLKLNQ